MQQFLMRPFFTLAIHRNANTAARAITKESSYRDSAISLPANMHLSNQSACLPVCLPLQLCSSADTSMAEDCRNAPVPNKPLQLAAILNEQLLESNYRSDSISRLLAACTLLLLIDKPVFGKHSTFQDKTRGGRLGNFTRGIWVL